MNKINRTLLAIVLAVVMLVSLAGIVLAADVTIHVKAASLFSWQDPAGDDYIGEPITGWHFVITSAPNPPPATIHVIWDNGTYSEDVPLDTPFNGKVAMYTTSLHSGSKVTDATAVVPQAWVDDGKGQFNLSHVTVDTTEPPAIKTGFKFNDLDKEGDWDAGEPSLEGWEIRAYADNDDANGILDQNEYDAGPVDTDITDSSGAYTFILDPGDYIVVEVLLTGWTQSYPGTDVVGPVTTGGETLGDYGYAITLASGDVDDDNNFGNYEEGGTETPPTTPPEVGGEVFPANPVTRVAPFIILALVLGSAALVLARRRV